MKGGNPWGSFRTFRLPGCPPRTFVSKFSKSAIVSAISGSSTGMRRRPPSAGPLIVRAEKEKVPVAPGRLENSHVLMSPSSGSGGSSSQGLWPWSGFGRGESRRSGDGANGFRVGASGSGGWSICKRVSAFVLRWQGHLRDWPAC